MPYTLTKGLLWFVLALLIGLVVGWLLRSIRATSQLRALRSTRQDSAELERLRGRVANLEPVVAERDRLQVELARRPAATSPAGDADPRTGEADSTATESEMRVADVVQVTEVIEVVALAPDTAAEAPEPPPAPDDPPPVATRAFADASAPDVSGAVAVLGRRIECDDLTVIEGIGPATAELCHRIGITTWADLADTEVSLLRTMLADAGPQLLAHHADTWPQQAGLLATGRWDDFRNLVATLESDKLGE